MHFLYTEVEQQETPNNSATEREAHNLHVADIAPPGRIQTVEVEVEPKRDTDEEEDASDDERKEPVTPPSPTDRDGVSSTSEATRDIKEDEQEPTASNTPPPTSQPSSEPPVHPPKEIHTSSIHPPPTHFTRPENSVTGLFPAVGEATSAASNLPPLSMTNPDAISEPMVKKKSKPVPSLTKDLFPLHKEVGYSNKQLVEPSTPEFKPTPEWVSNTRALLGSC